jgi:hypothetical protein
VLQPVVLLPDAVLHLRETLLHPARLGDSATDFCRFVVHAACLATLLPPARYR